MSRNSIKSKNCASGYENVTKFPNQKVEEHFSFNRIRLLPANPLPQAHLPSHLNTNPGFDKIGLRVQSSTASKYRDNDGIKYSKFLNAQPFRP